MLFFSVVSLYRNTTNSQLSISSKPGKNCLPVKGLYRLLFSLSPIKLSCFETVVPQIAIYLSL